jgi:hypothetical protein
MFEHVIWCVETTDTGDLVSDTATGRRPWSYTRGGKLNSS